MKNHRKKRKLTQKQKIFIECYLQFNNGKKAAIAAGYGEKGAHVTAHRLLNDVNYSHVREELERRKDEIFNALSLDTARTIKQIDNLISIDIRGFFDDNNQLKPISEWTKEQGMCVQSLRILRESEYSPKHLECPHCKEMILNPDKEVVVKQVVTEIKLTDRRDPLRLMAIHQNLLVNKHEHKHTVDDLSRRIRESKARALEAKKRREEEMKIKDTEFQVLPDPPAKLQHNKEEIEVF